MAYKYHQVIKYIIYIYLCMLYSFIFVSSFVLQKRMADVKHHCKFSSFPGLSKIHQNTKLGLLEVERLQNVADRTPVPFLVAG